MNAAVAFSEVYVCAVFLMVKEVRLALQKNAGNSTYITLYHSCRHQRFEQQSRLQTIYDRKLMESRCCLVGQKNNSFCSLSGICCMI